MKTQTYQILENIGYKCTQEDPSQNLMNSLTFEEIIRIEPYWRYLGEDVGFSCVKSWDEF